jgi:Mg2+/Co2+ transporter CorB
LDAVPLWAQILALTVLICISAFFAMTETALMAANRHRLRHLAQGGNKAPRRRYGCWNAPTAC